MSEKFPSIKDRRELLGISQRDFAQLVGISAPYLSEIETGRKELSMDVARKVKDGLSDLLFGIAPEFANNLGTASIAMTHKISFHPEEKQQRLYDLLIKEYEIRTEIANLMHGEDYKYSPRPPDLDASSLQGKADRIQERLRLILAKKQEEKTSSPDWLE